MNKPMHSSSPLVRALAFAIVSAATACGGAVESDRPLDPAVDPGSPPSIATTVSPEPTPVPSEPAPALATPPSDAISSSGLRQRCGQDGVTGISVTVTGLEAHEGRAVYLAVAEPHRDSGSQAWTIPVLLRADVSGGMVRFACPSGLHENYMYPTWALLLDENGDGRCDESDRGHVHADYYGWAENFEVEATLSGSDLTRTTKELAGRAFGHDFCKYYFATQ